MPGLEGALASAELSQRGFFRIGEWTLTVARELGLQGEPPSGRGVYAFVMDGRVQYIGVASGSLAKRLRFYVKPGASQRTNLRLNAVLCEALKSGGKVEVYVAMPPDGEWNGFIVSGPEGLEAGLIRSFNLPWNLRGATLAAVPVKPATVLGPASIGRVQPRVNGSHGKYGPLRDYLQNSGQDTVSMTFAEIQALVGDLPKSASVHQAWWGNHDGNSQAKAWMGARYLAEANPARRSVVFRKFSY